MLVALVVVAGIFLVLSTVLSVNNASILLSGYNTLSDAERAQVDVQGYVGHFRKFYRVFAGFYLIVGLVLHYLVNEDAAGIFVVIAPLIGVFIQTLTAAKYARQENNRSAKVVGFIVAGILVLVLGLMWLGYDENCMVYEKNGILITGAYGEQIAYSDISAVSLVDTLPGISMKAGGFAMGNAAKGFFKTRTDSTVKFLLNSKKGPFLLITKTNQQQLYFHSNTASTISAYIGLLQHLQAR